MCASDTLGEHTKVRTPFEDHLCRIIELQPVPVTRIKLDGTFLAVNMAALSMLGGERLDQVLEKSLLDLITPQQRGQCEELLGRLAAGERRSAEFDVTGLDSQRRAVLLHAVPIPEPHDGIASTICAWHVLTEQRRLEQAAIEAAACADEYATAHAEESNRLSAMIELERRNASAALTDHQSRISELEHQLAELGAREQAVASAKSEHREQTSRLQLEVARLEIALKAAVAEARQKTATHEAERAEFERTLRSVEAEKQRETSTHSQAVAELEGAVAAARAELERRVAEHGEEIARLDALLAGSAAEQQAAAREAAQVRIELQVLDMQLRRSHRLAQAGRLAVSIAGDVEHHFQTVSDRLRALAASAEAGDERHAALTNIASIAIDGAALAREISTAARTELESE